MAIRRVTYLSVLNRFFEAVGDPDGSDDLAASANVWINRRAKFAWEFYWWPEFTSVEKRTFRLEWDSSTSYAAPTTTAAVEVYHPGARKYYQSLRANTNEEPASYTAGAWVENSAYWAESKSSYSASYWAASTAYAVGDIVQRGPGSGSGVNYRYYQCHTAHTSSSSFDGTKFGVLTDFLRTIDYTQTGQTEIGEVRYVTIHDPRLVPSSPQRKHTLFADSVVVRGAETEVWLTFRQRIPSWTGADYSGTATYSIDDQVYDTTQGDYYKSLTNSNTGNAVTDTTNWERIDFPYIFQEYVGTGAAADFLLKAEENRTVLMGGQRDEAHSILLQEVDKIIRQQGQNQQLNVTAYR